MWSGVGGDGVSSVWYWSATVGVRWGLWWGCGVVVVVFGEGDGGW